MMINTDQIIVFDAKTALNVGTWYVVDDVVMGGQSSGKLAFRDNSYAVFSGEVSLENNGGFSSIRYSFEPIKVGSRSTISLRLRGDGKKYQFRIKTNRYDRHSYIYLFETSGEWQHIEIPLNQMVPSFRGRRLAIPNFEADFISEMGILIGNKKAESFQLEFEQITLQ